MNKRDHGQGKAEWNPLAPADDGELTADLLRDASVFDNESLPPAARLALTQATGLLENAAIEALGDHDLSSEEEQDVMSIVRDSASLGFMLALHRYAGQLQAVPELTNWRLRRTRGGDQGRVKQARAKNERISQILAMHKQGADPKGIASAVGCSLATVYRALTPSSGKSRKTAKRPPQR